MVQRPDSNDNPIVGIDGGAGAPVTIGSVGSGRPEIQVFPSTIVQSILGLLKSAFSGDASGHQKHK